MLKFKGDHVEGGLRLVCTICYTFFMCIPVTGCMCLLPSFWRLAGVTCLSSQSVSQVTARFPGLDEDDDDNDDSWGPLVLMGMTALNATVGLTRSNADPFSPTEVPLISVLPPTPDTTPKNANFDWDDGDMVCLSMGPAAPGDAMSQVSAHCAGPRLARFGLSDGGSASLTHTYSNRSMIFGLFIFSHSTDPYIHK
jgi:hypothetical protein